ncbi:RND transporter MFP subunit [Iodidimonas muriae]|uniref:RND transporter MFP subunit n=1 Tax=Iodidimonas muriae TaxID=261467 RepID=A0ABQ2LC48_9PROT|nr:efflux RND transporter periplasmic adaptor subunit [Iodidimonas muriae]GER06787.1 RND transporter MFP subunit [Kordiimonadales bacterium JCM 17843]GGO09965.1 RND transporter MFP subunit [Iodidimonas muriae]
MTGFSPTQLRRFSLLAGIAFIVIMLVILMGRIGFKESGAEKLTQERALPVSVLKVNIRDHYDISRGFTGRAVSRRQADLGFDSGGIVRRVLVDTGAIVEKGQILAVLDTDRLLARRSELVAQLAEADANLVVAQKTAERSRALFKQGHVTEQRLDDAVANADTAKARRSSANAALASLEVDIEKSRLIAPFDGMVSRRLLDEGAIVAAGEPVLSLIENGGLEAEVGMPLDFAHRLAAGDHVPLSTQDGDLVFAQVKAIVPFVRGETRTALVTMDITGDASQLIADGSLVTARITDPVNTSGFWLPLEALTADVRGLWRVYKVVLDEQGRHHVVFENVQILHNEVDRVFVSGTVRDGDLIIDGGVARVTPGKHVDIVQTRQMGPQGQLPGKTATDTDGAE